MFWSFWNVLDIYRGGVRLLEYCIQRHPVSTQSVPQGVKIYHFGAFAFKDWYFYTYRPTKKIFLAFSENVKFFKKFFTFDVRQKFRSGFLYIFFYLYCVYKCFYTHAGKQIDPTHKCAQETWICKKCRNFIGDFFLELKISKFFVLFGKKKLIQLNWPYIGL